MIVSACRWTFHRLGRAMIRPFYMQACKPLPGGKASNRLINAAKWWHHVLKMRTLQEVNLATERKVLDLFTDAASDPAVMSAVLFINHEVFYTTWEADDEFRSKLDKRKDKQIMALEMMAVLIGLATFRDKCQNTNLW